ncbi:MAG: hypothetical protein HY934_02610 [Candidatus Firestonebacteria bacterium]|nr:hypothetical protein [Candidatus Firestonebacteria bacterium]
MRKYRFLLLIIAICIFYNLIASLHITAQEEDISHPANIIEFIDKTAGKISEIIPEISGYVIHIKDNDLYIDLGRKHGVTMDIEFDIVREGKDIKHPIRNEFAGKIEEKIGKLKIKTLRETLSIAEISSLEADKKVEIGDRVYAVKRWHKLAILPIYNPKNEQQYFTNMIYDLLQSKIARTSSVELIKKEKIVKTLNDFGLSDTNNFLPEKVTTVLSNKLKADVMILGDMLDLGESIFLNLRFIDGEEGTTFFIINTEMEKTRRLRALLYSSSIIPGETSIQEKLPVILHAPIKFAPKTFDPSLSYTSEEKELLSHILDRLVYFDSSGAVKSSIAETWNVSKDGKIWIFNIKQNIKFHNGEILTANDVKNSWQYEILNGPQYGARNLLKSITGVSEYKDRKSDIEGIEVLDDFTLQISLNNEDPDFLKNLAEINTSVFSYKSLEEKGEILSYKNPVGTGPFKLLSQTEDKILLEKNQDYFAGDVFFDKIEFNIISDPTIEYQKFLSKELDYYHADGSLIKSDTDIVKSSFSTIYYVSINCSNSPFNDLKIRQALNYAIDREFYKQNLDEVFLSRTILPVYFDSTNDSTLIKFPYTYNPQDAKKMLEENKFETYFSQKFDLIYPEGSNTYKIIAEKLQENLMDVGVALQLKSKKESELLAMLEDTTPFSFILNSFTYIPSQHNNLSILKKSFSTSNKRISGNYGFYSNSVVDSLFTSALESKDEEKKFKTYIELENTILQEAPWIFLFTKTQKIIKQSDLQGITIDNFGVNFKKAYKIKTDSTGKNEEKQDIDELELKEQNEEKQEEREK